jgi:hypothetical protein
LYIIENKILKYLPKSRLSTAPNIQVGENPYSQRKPKDQAGKQVNRRQEEKHKANTK